MHGTAGEYWQKYPQIFPQTRMATGLRPLSHAGKYRAPAPGGKNRRKNEKGIRGCDTTPLRSVVPGRAGTTGCRGSHLASQGPYCGASHLALDRPPDALRVPYPTPGGVVMEGKMSPGFRQKPLPGGSKKDHRRSLRGKKQRKIVIEK